VADPYRVEVHAGHITRHVSTREAEQRLGDAVSASGAFDQPGNDKVPYTVQRAVDEFEFGLRCIIDGVMA